jgi:hypothetical protein
MAYLPVFLSSCDKHYSFGTVKNKSNRNIIVLFWDRPLTDSLLYTGRVRGIKVSPLASSKLYSGFGLPHAADGHHWYFYFYDLDTINKYRRLHQAEGITLKSFLKIDSCTEKDLKRRNIQISL